jgi:glycerate kinase
VVASDVDNPLLGPNGAASVYGPQKGATQEQVRHLNDGLGRLVEVLCGDLEIAPESVDRTCAGAAGGVGFAAIAVLDATPRPGIDYLLNLINFSKLLAGASAMITGEGSLDAQTLHGKAPAGVAATARAHQLPVFAAAGRCPLADTDLANAGFAGAHVLTDIEPDTARCVAEAGPLLERLAAERLAKDLAAVSTRRVQRGAT